jgi:hypothetical protein
MLTELEQELTASSTDSRELLERLKALQTEAESWKLLSEEYAKRLEAFENSMREADRAYRLELWTWRAAAAAGAVAGVAGLVYGLTR